MVIFFIGMEVEHTTVGAYHELRCHVGVKFMPILLEIFSSELQFDAKALKEVT